MPSMKAPSLCIQTGTERRGEADVIVHDAWDMFWNDPYCSWTAEGPPSPITARLVPAWAI